jgi:hypothetical protein
MRAEAGALPRGGAGSPDLVVEEPFGCPGDHGVGEEKALVPLAVVVETQVILLVDVG